MRKDYMTKCKTDEQIVTPQKVSDSLCHGRMNERTGLLFLQSCKLPELQFRCLSVNLYSDMQAISVITVFTASLIKYYYLLYALSIITNPPFSPGEFWKMQNYLHFV